MPHTLESFAAAAHDILVKEPTPQGRDKVRALLQDVLLDRAFVAKHLADDVPERKVLYEDPGQPHDHGKYWAIYGQAEGETVMSDWQIVEPATGDTLGKVRHVRAYPLKPGMAKVYNEGDVQSPRRDGATKLIRIEGRNMEGQPRGTFEKI